MNLLPAWRKKRNQSGQALLILLLVMAVALTASLSVVSRSITDISTTTYEEDATRALSAAETGVEEALFSGEFDYDPGEKELDNGSTYTPKVEIVNIDSSGSGAEFVYPVQLNSGDSAVFWLVSQNEDGEFICAGGSDEPCFRGNGNNPNLSPIEIYWQRDESGNTPSVEVSVFYDNANSAAHPVNPNYADVEAKHYIFDAGSIILGTTRSWANVAYDMGNTTFNYRTGNLINYYTNGVRDIPITCINNQGCLLMLNVRVIGNASPISVAMRANPSSNGDVPAQGLRIESLGTSGDSTRKVEVYQSFPAPQSVFDSAIYSYSDIVKN